MIMLNANMGLCDKLYSMAAGQYWASIIICQLRVLWAAYGDYMTFSPKEKQVLKHNFDAYWRDRKVIYG